MTAPPILRYKAVVQYVGSAFAGWAKQRGNGPVTVQGVLEEACNKISKGCSPNVYGAGRTDAGVHAIGQVFHFDLQRPSPLPAKNARDAVNFHIRALSYNNVLGILDVCHVPPTFHARFDATHREYVYRLVDGARTPVIFQDDRAWVIPVRSPLCVRTMQEAAASVFSGERDFTSFTVVGGLEENMRKVRRIDYVQVQESSSLPPDHTARLAGGREITVRVKAQSFLYRQVRRIVGALVECGQGRRSIQELQNIRDLADPAQNPCNIAPAHGLYLFGVGYPAHLASP
eukprot:CAMPEP_0175132156 /NCGR_PEP_ID=MMETSP0087-20121206/6925_1 /TAXON_ID=136419 /ORGANISM="Unknown Unknown, Strain D1" /LENGTH=286 /DNA_ID=CAMNT_0016414493 /DNA_START=40 /DNA_END=903 /DNA_ORIENTATION=+